MRSFRDIFVQLWAVDSRFVTDETGFEARFTSGPGLDEQQEELKIDRVSRATWPV
ncbi:hypothetical protein [Erythrobacter alti]|uniref:hypothetical protein n=1 Tax=Erythrobacter alti TaxID=1896145 RepID=UPI0030F479F7